MSQQIKGRKQRLIVQRNFSSLSAEKKALIIAKILHPLNADLTRITGSGYKNEGAPLIKAILKHFKINETDKNRFNMYCTIRRNKDTIQRCLREMSGTNKEVYEGRNYTRRDSNVMLTSPDNIILQVKETSDKTFVRETVTDRIETVYEENTGKGVVISDDDENMDAGGNAISGIVDFTEKPITITFPLIVPEKSEGILKTPVSSRRYRQCNLFIGRLEVEGAVWQSMVDENGKMKTSVYPQVLSERFFTISKGCILQMNSCRMLKRNQQKLATIYAYCSHNNTTTFKLSFFKKPNVSDIEVHVFSNNRFCTHENKKTRELSGFHRDLAKKEVIHEHPRMMRLRMVDQVDREGVTLYNLQKVKSGSVFRKVKSEALAADDLHPDPLTDLFLMRSNQEDPGARYVQYVCHPLQVILFSKESLELAHFAKLALKTMKKEFTVHIDATGSVVRPTKDCLEGELSKKKGSCTTLSCSLLAIRSFL